MMINPFVSWNSSGITLVSKNRLIFSTETIANDIFKTIQILEQNFMIRKYILRLPC